MRRGGLGSKLLNIALLVIATLAIGVAEAAGTGSNVLVGFANSSLAAGPGDIITVSIMVDPDGYGVQSGELVLHYDREGLEVVSVAPGGIRGDSPLVVRKEYNDTAIVPVVARPGSPAAESGSAVEAVFRVVGIDGIYAVRIARAVFADSDGNDLPVYVEANECLVRVYTYY